MRNVLYIVCLLVCVFACDDIIEVEDISNRTVETLAPADNAILSTTSPTFTWNALNDADEYVIQIAQPSFSNASQIVLDSVVTTTSFTKTLEPSDYEWRVKAQNSGFETVYTTQGFTVDASGVTDITDSNVALLAPANEVVLTAGDLSFSWEELVGADSYVLQIATPDFANATEIVTDETLTDTSFTVSDLAVNDYEWRVKATNLLYETSFTTQSFTIEE